MTLYMGIDWSSKKHDVTFLNEKGGVIQTATIEHSAAGFHELEKLRSQLQVTPEQCVVGMETAHSLLIDHLWSEGYEAIYVLPPGAVQANRGRLRQSGARDDRYDSQVIAETLRTDRHRFHPWGPGSPTLQRMRVLMHEVFFWTKETVRLANRLEAMLLRYYPAARYVFPSWPTRIVCALLQAYPEPAAAASLTWSEFQAFARQHRYTKRRELPACFQRLQQPYPQVRPELVPAYGEAAQQLAAALDQSMQVKQTTVAQLHKVFLTHPDAHIFDSLPGVGTWLGPALLVKVGEDRQRFPTANALQALAGTCPVTSQSGGRKSVRFRRSCDHQFRQIAQQWARSAVKVSPWAATYYASVYARVGSHNQAFRSLANRLLAILWRIWQDGTEYDENLHLQNRAKRCQPAPSSRR